MSGELSDGAAAALETEERSNEATAAEWGMTVEEAEALVEQGKRPGFDPSKHLRQLRGRGGTADYLDVKWRVEWFRSQNVRGTIKSWVIKHDENEATFRCRVRDDQGAEAWGHGSETARDFGDYFEKAETKAIGRALASLGYGTVGVLEMTKPGESDPVVVDAPVDRRDYGRDDRVAYNGAATQQQPQREKKIEPASKSQIRDMNALIDELGLEGNGLKEVFADAGVAGNAHERGMSRLEAGKLLYELQKRKDKR